jgi:hypothetical protein
MAEQASLSEPTRVSYNEEISQWWQISDIEGPTSKLGNASASSHTSDASDEGLKLLFPRFYIGFRSLFSAFPTLYFSKGSKDGAFLKAEPPQSAVGLSEIHNGFVASLVLSSALMGMASEGILCHTKRQHDTGWVEFGVDEEHLAWSGIVSS